MAIKLIQGDLFTAKCDIIAHGCNCSGGFGSGVAGQIAKRWPRVREAYLQKYQKSGWKLGEIQLVFSTNDLELPIIANIATQEDFGYDGQLYVDYKAVKTGLNKVFKYCNEHNLSVALPKIGCGLAGGDWDKVYQIIQTLSSKYPSVAIEVYEL